ncbi:MAG: manganese efflux pump [Clostridiales bacterium]|jgi:putative Mn2+ efflux pump MntP|nr:manganese efflux pump [Clostridiales bacterium]
MAVFFAVALSIDALGMGISCGLRKQRPTIAAFVVLFVVSVLVMAASVFFGEIIASFLAADLAEKLAAGWLAALGLWIALGALRKKQEDLAENPAKITKWGSVQLALVLSLDSMGAGIAAASLGINIHFLPFLVAAFQIGFLAAGLRLATVFKLKGSQRFWTLLAGLILVLMAIIRLIQ